MSQWSFNCLVFCSTPLAGSRTGPNIQTGSKVELIVPKHPRLVSSFNCFCGSDSFTPNESVSVFHCSPSALSMGNLSRSRFSTVPSFAGMVANTSLLLEGNFVRRKFPFFNNCINCKRALIARSVVGTQNKQSCTWKSLVTISNTSLLNSVWLSIAVLFRAQAAIHVESALPNKWKVILWSHGGSSTHSLHHKNRKASASSSVQATLFKLLCQKPQLSHPS